jgi:hypothetical protein
MSLNPTKFNPGEDLSLSGKPMKVSGLVQYDAGDGKIVNRYLLFGPGSSLVLQEEDASFSLLRPFPAAAPPEAEGNTVSVMGEKYTLGGVRRLKVVGAAGDPPGGAPKGPLLLSAQFAGTMGSLLRELVPGKPEQTYYFVKPVGKDELLTGEELAKRIEGERLAAEVAEQADESEATAKSQGPMVKVAVWVVAILVIGGLVYACSGSDDDSSSSSSGGSVRVGTGSHGHGGK